MGPMINANIVQYTRLYKERNSWSQDSFWSKVLIIDYLTKELKVEPQYTQVFPAQEDFPDTANNTIPVELNVWVQLAC